MAVNTQKLLPAAKTTSALAKANVGKIFSSSLIKTKKIDTAKLVGPLAKRDEPGAIVNTLTDIDTRLKLILGEEQRQQNKKKKEKEKAEFQKAEEKLEAPKEAKKFKLPGLAVPGMSFLDRIKRFLFFTALGWLFTKFQDQLPKLEGILKTITQVYGIAENIFKFLLESFVNLIDRGYQTYDKVRDLAKSIGGEKAQQDFDKLSGKLNEYINYVLIGGMALTGAINSFNKAAGRSTAQVAKEAAKKTTGEIAKRAATKGILQKTAQASRIGATKATQAVVGKQATRQLLRLAKGPLSRLPVIGALVEFGLSWALGDNPGKAAFRGVGTLLLGAVGSLIVPGFGTFAGGWAGAELAGKLYEVLFENKQPKGKVQKKQTGGPVTRGGKTQGAPTRTIRVTRRKPPKVKPQTSQPGKDVGGKKKVKELYPDPSAKTDIEGPQKGPWWNLLPPLPKNATPQQIQDRDNKIKKLPNPYKALTSTAKTLKDIPFGIGALMGGAVDIALGQKLPKNAIDGLSNGISYLINTLANQQVAKSISGIQKEIATMQTGGITPRRNLLRTEESDFGSSMNKIFNNLIQEKVDQAIREVQKQLMPRKYDEGVKQPGKTQPTAPPGGAPPGPLPTGKNGRYNRSELTYVQMMNPAEILEYNDWYGRKIYLRPDAAAAFRDAQKAAGPKIRWVLNSGYRSLEHQQALISKGYPAAPLGTSDHGDGIALDIEEGTNGHSWLVKNGAKYGWKWPAIKGDLVHFYYDGSYTAKGQKVTPSNIFQPQQPQQPGGVSPLFQRQTGQSTSKASGKASWYGPGFHGNRTASGAIFNQNALTAASNTLPFGTKVRVRNKANGKVVEVTITDKGPFEQDLVTPHRTRIIDLSKGAMDKLGGISAGEIDVDLSYQGGGYITSPNGQRIKEFMTPGTKDRMPTIYDTMPTPIEIRKQNFFKKGSIASYPSYSAEGGMMIAIQPMIIEKPVPVPSGKNGSIIFPIPVGVNNSSMQSLSRG